MLEKNDGLTYNEAYRNDLIDRQLASLRAPIEVNPVNKREVWLATLEFIPLFNKINREWMDYGDKINQLLILQDNLSIVADSARDINHAFSIVGLITYVLDFFSLPVIYLAAYLLGKKLPIETGRMTRWLLSGLILAIALTGFFVPAIAPYLTIASTAFFLGVGVLTLGFYLYKKWQLSNNLAAIRVELSNKIKEWEDEIELFEQELLRLKGYPTQTKEMSDFVNEAVDNLSVQIAAKREKIQKLLDSEAKIDAILKAMNTMALVDKSLAVAVSVSALTGVVLALFFPVPATVLLFVTATIATSYFFGRLITPWIKRGWMALKEKFTGSGAVEAHDSTKGIQSLLHSQQMPAPANTSNMIAELEEAIEENDLDEIYCRANDLFKKLTEEKDIESLYSVLNLLARIEFTEDLKESLTEDYQRSLTELDPALQLVKISSVKNPEFKEKLPQVAANPGFKEYLLSRVRGQNEATDEDNGEENSLEP